MSKYAPIVIFRKSMQILVDVLIIYIIVVMALGLCKTIYGARMLFGSEPMGAAFTRVITDILTFLVIIELFRSFVEYFETHRFRLHALITPALVFVLRELIVALFNHQMNAVLLMAFGVLILALGLVRALAVHFSPADDQERRPEECRTEKEPDPQPAGGRSRGACLGRSTAPSWDHASPTTGAGRRLLAFAGRFGCSRRLRRHSCVLPQMLLGGRRNPDVGRGGRTEFQRRRAWRIGSGRGAFGVYPARVVRNAGSPHG
ncbi:MAG: hypothetical protein PWQ57_790 [Desulfovibrionales bacterium]|nr:hypothetical protein [Desulfovibrionales bacterium]